MPSPASDLRNHSLTEIHSSVPTAHASLWRRLLAFAGPAYLVSVGYMDPGNWATDLEAGSKFGYRLLWVLVMSNAMAILLQTLSARLGVVSGRDLAQACRESYPAPVSHALWLLCEVAIAACDLAEVLGAAIGLNLLFGLPLLAGVLVTATDTLLLLTIQQFRVRSLEMVVIRILFIIGACLGMEVYLAKPQGAGLLLGMIPHLNRDTLYTTIAILGATVMPHNLYLHSALVQSRRIGTTVEAKRKACRYNLADTMIALNGAMVVNIILLVLAGAVFFTRGVEVSDIRQATRMLEPLLGTNAAVITFAVALLLAGQASTLTGTMAGQIVMEGFLNFRMRAWVRRLMTRALAIGPAAVTVYVMGDKGAYQLLLLTQAVLSLQLPFAVIPLIRLTADRRRMGELVNSGWLTATAWGVAGINLLLNLWLAQQELTRWLTNEGLYLNTVRLVVVGLLIALILLLVYIWIAPLRRPSSESNPGAANPAWNQHIFMDHLRGEGAQNVAERLDMFMTHLRGLAFIKDPSGRFVYINDAATALLGLAPEQMLSKRDSEIWAPQSASVFEKNDLIVYKESKTFEGIEVIPVNGELHSWLIYKFPIIERSTQTVFLGGVGVDITGRKQSEEQLRSLAARLQSVREKERALTSREIHDIGQLLTALDVHLSTIAARLDARTDREGLSESLAAASKLLASAIECSTRISTDLRPSVLDNLGLAAAISWRVQEFASQSGIRAIAKPLDKAYVAPEVGVLAFRLLEESLSNVEKHAGATEVRVSLIAEGDNLVLQVRDNGKGITAAQVEDPQSLGLVEMRERAKLFAGHVHITGVPGSGTSVSVEIPIGAEIQDAARGNNLVA